MSPPPKHHFSGKAPADHKSKFVQTCNRLSLFLKENNNSIRDLTFKKFDATGKTVDLLSSIDDPVHETGAINAPLPQYVIVDSSACEIENSANKSASCSKPKTEQMTIFYGGQVLVLDDVPADKARDLMSIATKGLNKQQQQQPQQPNEKLESLKGDQSGGELKDSDLPIARRASLHKFLAKRKDRATVRAPYQQSPGGSSSGNEHSFDLNM